MIRLIGQIETLWCMSMHRNVLWPFRGHYHCRTCFREYPVLFENPEAQIAERLGVSLIMP